MPDYVESREIGPLSYRIAKNGPDYQLWLNGCRIGRPRSDKPAGDIWEYKTRSLKAARKEMEIDATERIDKMIKQTEAQLKTLRETYLTVYRKS